MQYVVPLAACQGQPASRVGRKSEMLAWAQAQGLCTPGGLVVSSELFWSALEACGVSGQARYLATSALTLDPAHAHRIARSIESAMAPAKLEALAAPYAKAVFADIHAPVVVCRSSSAMEDGQDAAFPGVFLSRLGIASREALASALAACWRSAFSETAMAYLLRVRPRVVDFSLAALVQPQIEAAWYGVYFGLDPVSGAPEPAVELSNASPDALVNGEAPTLRFRRRGGAWIGDGLDPPMPIHLEGISAAAALLAGRLGDEVDMEFALRGPDQSAVILQARPLSRPQALAGLGLSGNGGDESQWAGIGCAPGRVSGTGVAPGSQASRDPADDDRATIAIADRLTTQDYPVLFAHAGAIAEAEASPLSHVAILCRELGVPFVAGVPEARARLTGRRLVVDGGTGKVWTIAAGEAAVPSPSRAPIAAGEAVLTTTELLVRLLTEAELGPDPVQAARLVLQAYARSLGCAAARLETLAMAPSEANAFDKLGAERFGQDFSAEGLLRSLGALAA